MFFFLLLFVKLVSQRQAAHGAGTGGGRSGHGTQGGYHTNAKPVSANKFGTTFDVCANYKKC